MKGIMYVDEFEGHHFFNERDAQLDQMAEDGTAICYILECDGSKLSVSIPDLEITHEWPTGASD